MQWLADAHLGFGIILALAALAMAIRAWTDRRAGALSPGFFRGLSHYERLLVLQALLGVVLYLTRHRAADPLHYLYGGVMLVVAAIDQAVRPGRSLREALAQDYGRFNEPVVYAILTLILFIAAGRGIMTGIWGF
jgi:hypothetical protein